MDLYYYYYYYTNFSGNLEVLIRDRSGKLERIIMINMAHDHANDSFEL